MFLCDPLPPLTVSMLWFFCRTYADLLEAKLPTTQTTSGQQYRLLDGGEVAICYVVNTAEYCADILPQLEDMIKCVWISPLALVQFLAV